MGAAGVGAGAGARMTSKASDLPGYKKEGSGGRGVGEERGGREGKAQGTEKLEGGWWPFS